MKRLAEYCGLDHECLCMCHKGQDITHFVSCCQPPPDFTTGNGWETLSAAITAKGFKSYSDFYVWLHTKDTGEQKLVGTEAAVTISRFHEKPDAEKSRIFNEYLAAKGD